MTFEPWTILIDGKRQSAMAALAGEQIWLASDSLPALLGWEVDDGKLCRQDRCIPPAPHPEVVRGTQVDLVALARLLNMPLALAAAHRVLSLAESPEQRSALLLGGDAPDFALQDIAGQTHRLSDYRGRKVLLVTWASWCGCREDLPEWQAQHAALSGHGLTVITVSQDAKAADAAPFIEAASPRHPALLDPDHIVSHLYGLINVPTVIWIDEAGRIARPPRVEHATNRFSFAHGLDCEPHLAALRRWAETGETDFAADQMRRSTMPASFAEQQARAHHALAWHLYQVGAAEDASAHWREAIQLSPFDWTIRRGSMWLRGENPFGTEFAEAWMEWESAGRPDYATLAAARAEPVA
jgi:peroxiredoxin